MTFLYLSATLFCLFIYITVKYYIKYYYKYVVTDAELLVLDKVEYIQDRIDSGKFDINKKLKFNSFIDPMKPVEYASFGLEYSVLKMLLKNGVDDGLNNGQSIISCLMISSGKTNDILEIIDMIMTGKDKSLYYDYEVMKTVLGRMEYRSREKDKKKDILLKFIEYKLPIEYMLKNDMRYYGEFGNEILKDHLVLDKILETYPDYVIYFGDNKIVLPQTLKDKYEDIILSEELGLI